MDFEQRLITIPHKTEREDGTPHRYQQRRLHWQGPRPERACQAVIVYADSPFCELELASVRRV